MLPFCLQLLTALLSRLPACWPTVHSGSCMPQSEPGQLPASCRSWCSLTDFVMYSNTTTPCWLTVVKISPFALKSTAVNGVDRVKPRDVVAGCFTEDIKPPFTSGVVFQIFPKELLSVVCAAITLTFPANLLSQHKGVHACRRHPHMHLELCRALKMLQIFKPEQNYSLWLQNGIWVHQTS